MRQGDEVRLRHMLDAAEEAATFAEGKTRQDLKENRQLALSIVKLLEVIGEAATKVGSATRDEAPAIPWPEITGMRHRLIHAYYEIDYDRVWTTLMDDLPPLIEELRKMLAQDEEAGDSSEEQMEE